MKTNTAYELHSAMYQLTVNVMPKFADSAIQAYLTGRDLTAAKEDLLFVADRIMESGQEAATGKNWACSTFEKLKELGL